MGYDSEGGLKKSLFFCCICKHFLFTCVHNNKANQIKPLNNNTMTINQLKIQLENQLENDGILFDDVFYDEERFTIYLESHEHELSTLAKDVDIDGFEFVEVEHYGSGYRAIFRKEHLPMNVGVLDAILFDSKQTAEELTWDVTENPEGWNNIFPIAWDEMTDSQRENCISDIIDYIAENK
jgi:hypothetical protein